MIKNWETEPPQAGGEVYLLDNFPVYKQQTDHTCGPAAARMILEYLGVEVSEQQLARRCLTLPHGTLHWTVRMGFGHYAQRAGLKVKTDENSPDIYERIKQNLARGLPTMFLYAAMDHFHPPRRCTHYGALIGVDEPAHTVTIANPFGSIHAMNMREWWERFSLLPKYAPLMELGFLLAGVLKPRTAFFLENKQ